MRAWGRLQGIAILLVLVLLAQASAIDLPPALTLSSNATTVIDTVIITAVGIDLGSTNQGLKYVHIFEDGSQIEDKVCSGASTCVAPKVVFHGPASTHTYTARTEDLSGNIVNAGPISVTFTGTQTPPLLQNLPDVSIDEDSFTNSNLIDLHAFASDLQDSASAMNYSIFSQSNTSAASCIVVGSQFIECTTLPNASGTNDVMVFVTDTQGDTGNGTFTLTINPVNDAPTFVNLGGFNLEIPLNSSGSVSNMSLYFFDIDGDPLTLIVNQIDGISPFNISVNILNFSFVNYTPAIDFTGNRSVQYIAQDPSGLSVNSTGTFQINVSFNDAPQFNGTIGPVMLFQGQSRFFNLSLFAFDVNGDNLNFNINVTQNISASVDNTTKILNITANNTFFEGNETFLLTVTDGSKTDTQVITVEVIGNMTPTINFSLVNLTLPEDTANTTFLNLSKVTMDVDSMLSFINYQCNVTQPNVTVTADNTTKLLSINATGNFTGITVLTCLAIDPTNSSVMANTTINITPVNDAPQVILAPFNLTIGEENNTFSINMSQFFIDVDGDQLNVTGTGSQNVTVNFTGPFGDIFASFFPDSDFSGKQEMNFTAFDPSGSNVTISITFNVTEINDAPIVFEVPNISIKVNGTNNSINMSLFVFDRDHSDDLINWSVGGDTRNLTISIDNITKILTITPDKDFVGNRTINFTAVDPAGATNTTNVTNVEVADFNTPPFLNGTDNGSIANLTILEDQKGFINLSQQFVEIDNETIGFAVVTLGPNLTVVIDNNTGIANISPDLNFNGNSSIIFVAIDQRGANATSNNVSVFVLSVNDLPVFSQLPNITVEEDGFNDTINLSDFTSDVDHALSEINYTTNGTVPNVTITIDNVTKIVNITPGPNFFGNRSVTFIAIDPENGTAFSNTTIIIVSSVNDPPTLIANISDITVAEDTNITINLSQFFIDVEGDDINYTAVASGNLTVITNNITKIATISGVQDFNGNFEAIVFIAEDFQNSTLSNAFIVNITPVNDAPFFNNTPGPIQVLEDSFNDSILLSNFADDVDDASTTLNFSLLAPGQNLTITIDNTTKRLNITPDPNFFGNVTIQFVVTDPQNATGTSNVTIVVVNGVNDAPTVTTIPNQTFGAGGFTVISLGSFFSDVDGDDLNFTFVFTGNITVTVDNASDVATISGGVEENGSVVFTAFDPSGLNVTSNNVTITVGPPTTEVVNSVINGTVVTPNDNYSSFPGAFSTDTIFLSRIFDSTINDDLSLINLSHVNGSSALTNTTMVNSFTVNSTLIDSILINSTVLDSILVNAVLINAFVDPSNITGSTIVGGSMIIDSNFTFSLANMSNVTNSDVNGSTITNSVIQGSTLNGVTLDGATVTNCAIEDLSISSASISDCILVKDVVINNSNISGATLQNSTIEDSTVNNSVLNASTVTNSTVTDSTVTDSTVDNSTTSTSTVDNTTVTGSTTENSTITDSTIDGSSLDQTTSDSSTITDSTVIFPSLINQSIVLNTSVANSTVFNSTLQDSIVNFSTVTDSTLNRTTIIDSSVEDSVITDAYIEDNVIFNGTIFTNNMTFNITTPTNLSDIINFGPLASFLFSPSPGTAGSTMTFTSTSTDRNVGSALDDNITISYDFGDGSVIAASANTPRGHVFSSAGTFNVTIFVNDSFEKTASFSTPVVVQAAATGGGSFGGGGGGGGGRGGSSSGNLFDVNIQLRDNFTVTRNARPGNRFVYDARGTQASTLLESASLDGAIMIMNPGNKRINLSEGDVFRHDVNGDNVYDVRVEVLTISPFGVQFGWILVKQVVPLSERVKDTPPAPVTTPDTTPDTNPIPTPGVTPDTAPDVAPDTAIEPEPTPWPWLPTFPSVDGSVLLGLLLMTMIVVGGIGSYMYVEWYHRY